MGRFGRYGHTRKGGEDKEIERHKKEKGNKEHKKKNNKKSFLKCQYCPPQCTFSTLNVRGKR